MCLKCSSLSSEVAIMSRYKIIRTAYSSQKKKNVPIWRLDVSIMTVTHFTVDTHTEEYMTYNTDYIRYHLHCSGSKYPDRLHRFVNEGKIIKYLDNLKLKTSKAIDRQVERWKKLDKEYQAFVLSGDVNKLLGLKNCFIGMAREAIFDCMIYV